MEIKTLSVNGKEYEIIKLLGKGKGGYSYLATDGKNKYTLKQIHHEPCSYYQFGDKIQGEINDYKRLKNFGIAMPEMIDVDDNGNITAVGSGSASVYAEISYYYSTGDVCFKKVSPHFSVTVN